MSGREEVSFSLKCPSCKKKGTITLEEDTAPVYGRGRSLTSVSEGFKHLLKHDKGDHFGVVCTKCGVNVPY